MTFLSPSYLWLLLAVAALAALYVVVQLRRKRYVARFSNVDLLGSIAPRRPGWRRHLTFALLLVALTVLSIGVAKPSAAVRVPRERATVMLAIDVSLSMEADDVLPSRIAAAKSAATEFVGLLPSRINLGLVSFGGVAALQQPPSLNRDAVKKSIEGLTLQKSTAIGAAIMASLQAIQTFDKSTTTSGDKPAPARIVLLSDGVTTVGPSNAEAVAAARKAHVQVSTISFGGSSGVVTIDGVTQPVPTDPAALKAIADQTGGTFHSAHSEQELSKVYQNIGSQIGYTTQHKDISWRFLLAGLLTLFAAGGVSMLWAGRLT